MGFFAVLAASCLPYFIFTVLAAIRAALVSAVPVDGRSPALVLAFWSGHF